MSDFNTIDRDFVPEKHEHFFVVAQLVDAYGDAVSAAALARGTSRYDDAVANAAGARSALIAEIERLRKQRDELLDALGDLHDAIMEIAKKADAVIARAEGRSDG